MVESAPSWIYLAELSICSGSLSLHLNYLLGKTVIQKRFSHISDDTAAIPILWCAFYLPWKVESTKTELPVLSH